MNISRITTSSRACFSSSGVLGWPALVAWAISASTRALGTAFPLTTATFWASAASGASRASETHAATDNFLMGSLSNSYEVRASAATAAKRWLTAGEGKSSVVVRGAGLDGQGVD